MKNKTRHLLGISGGKDSCALAVYLHNKYPEINIEYYFCDTDKELDETYRLIEKLEIFLNKKIIKLKAAEDSPIDQFDYFLKLFGGYLPSSNARWCTQKLKLEPFEKFVGNDSVISYVAIRGDENREGYISHKTNIQSIFPFRRNIWSEEIIDLFFNSRNYDEVLEIFSLLPEKRQRNELIKIFREPFTFSYNKIRKLNDLLNLSVKSLNLVIFNLLRNKNFPVSYLDYYPIIENEDNLNINDIFDILKESGIGMPEYYNKKEFYLNNEKGYYSRSRSGCFFCFFQQKIEWIWLYENHLDLFEKAMEYEKDGYTWIQGESLKDLIKKDRIEKIKQNYLKKMENSKQKKSSYLIDLLDDEERDGCNICTL